VGWAGIWLGRIDVMFSKNNVQKTATASVIKVHEQGI
jgi:hypothetical protein